MAVVCDMSPLRVPVAWTKGVAARLDAASNNVPLFQVDAHNVVPVWVSSNKREYAARTIRPKIQRLLPTYLTEFPKIEPQLMDEVGMMPPVTNWAAINSTLQINRSVKPVSSFFFSLFLFCVHECT